MAANNAIQEGETEMNRVIKEGGLPDVEAKKMVQVYRDKTMREHMDAERIRSEKEVAAELAYQEEAAEREEAIVNSTRIWELDAILQLDEAISEQDIAAINTNDSLSEEQKSAQRALVEAKLDEIRKDYFKERGKVMTED